eukprot:jgi/Mesen1/9263/ME000006S09260
MAQLISPASISRFSLSVQHIYKRKNIRGGSSSISYSSLIPGSQYAGLEASAAAHVRVGECFPYGCSSVGDGRLRLFAVRTFSLRKMAFNTTQAAQKSEKVVVITGVSKGLGKALAIELAKRGHIIAGCGRSEGHLKELAAQLGGKHFFKVADVVSDSSMQEFARETLEKLGCPDIVPADEFDRVMDVNLKGPANVIRHFAPPMVARSAGVIVNFSSGWGRSAAAEVGPYCTTKWGIEGLTKSLAKELPPGMTAVALNPGVIDTDMLQSCFGPSASMYTSPQEWAPQCADLILQISPNDNGASLTV